MTNDTADVEAIASLPFVKGLPAHMHHGLARLLARLSEAMECGPDDVIIREGEIGGASGYILLDGSVQVAREGKPPVQVRAPALFGEMHQFNPHAARTATIATVDRARLLVFPWRDLYEESREIFTEGEQQLLLEGLERLVWQRVDRGGLWDLSLFDSLPDALRVKAGILLLWVGQSKCLKAGEILFEQDSLCGNTGFLLLRGKLALTAGNHAMSGFTAPDVLGVQPAFAPERRWTATARALSEVEVLSFSWLDYLKRLQNRLPSQDFRAVVQSVETQAGKHFAG
ncbi:MAG: cyclic nucleotide-binding domain-containing protein [Candidatus Hydrogenedentes bacterium]|nr:cyclic nucleotide-binding domain-containing protein [Candidatus Hydrogenedentota bacterium]